MMKEINIINNYPLRGRQHFKNVVFIIIVKFTAKIYSTFYSTSILANPFHKLFHIENKKVFHKICHKRTKILFHNLFHKVRIVEYGYSTFCATIYSTKTRMWNKLIPRFIPHSVLQIIDFKMYSTFYSTTIMPQVVPQIIPQMVHRLLHQICSY